MPNDLHSQVNVRSGFTSERMSGWCQTSLPSHVCCAQKVQACATCVKWRFPCLMLACSPQFFFFFFCISVLSDSRMSCSGCVLTTSLRPTISPPIFPSTCELWQIHCFFQQEKQRFVCVCWGGVFSPCPASWTDVVTLYIYIDHFLQVRIIYRWKCLYSNSTFNSIDFCSKVIMMSFESRIIQNNQRLQNAVTGQYLHVTLKETVCLVLFIIGQSAYIEYNVDGNQLSFNKGMHRRKCVPQNAHSHSQLV